MNNYLKNPVSLYQSLKNTDRGKTVPLGEVLENIKNGYYENEIVKLRSMEDPAIQRSYKGTLPNFTASGLFDERKVSGLIQHNGVLVLDLDKLENHALVKEKLKKENSTAFIFDSCRGNGLAVGVLIDGNKHQKAFTFFKEYYKTKFNLDVDNACQDVARTRIVSYDPGLYINESPTVLVIPDSEDFPKPSEGTEQIMDPVTFGDDEKYEFCKKIIESKHNYKSGERHDFLFNMFGFLNKVGVSSDFALNKVIHDYSVPSQTPKKIKSIHDFCYQKTEAHGTFKIISIEGSKGQFKSDDRLKKINRYAHKKNKEGTLWTEEDVDYLSTQHLLPHAMIRDTFEYVFNSSKEEFGFNQLTTIQKVEIFLKKNYEIRKNIITQQVEYRLVGEEMFTAINENSLYRELQHQGIKFSLQNLASLLQSDFVESYNPFLHYFESLPAWDEIDHIAELANCVKADDQPFFNELFKKALVRSIACSCYNIVNRIVMVLVSEKQELGKSSFIRFLNPFGEKYYTESSLRDNKDSDFKLVENFIYNLEELSSLSSMDVNKLKATISVAIIKERRPYAKNEVEAPRRCNFWGSTNKEEFLTDTSNTRWLCFTVDEIDWSYNEKVDIHKVWAQAMHLYKTGFKFNLTKEEQNIREERNKLFEMSSNESDLINKYFAVCRPGKDGSAQFFSITEIAEHLKKTPEGKNITFNRFALGRALSQSGFHKDKKRCNKKMVRGYWMKPTGGMSDESIPTSATPLFDI